MFHCLIYCQHRNSYILCETPNCNNSNNNTIDKLPSVSNGEHKFSNSNNNHNDNNEETVACYLDLNSLIDECMNHVSLSMCIDRDTLWQHMLDDVFHHDHSMPPYLKLDLDTNLNHNNIYSNRVAHTHNHQHEYHMIHHLYGNNGSSQWNMKNQKHLHLSAYPYAYPNGHTT